MSQEREETVKSRIVEAKARGDWSEVLKIKIAEANERGAKKRGWVVLRKAWLTSSINYRMSLEEIAVFSKLIVMADEFGPVPGLISDNDCRAMPHEYLAHQACCPIEVLESMLAKGVQDISIYENSHGILLTHFDDYQFTEYDRQKPYREAKKEKAESESIVSGIFEEMRACLGYPDKIRQDPIPSYGKEGQAIKRMLTRGFTREAIMACWKSKVSQRGGEFVSMTWVNQDIGQTGKRKPGVKLSSEEEIAASIKEAGK